MKGNEKYEKKQVNKGAENYGADGGSDTDLRGVCFVREHT